MSRHGAVLARRAPLAPVDPAPAPHREVLPVNPWTAAHLRGLILVIGLTGVVLAVAWYGASVETTWRVQVRWIGLGVLACALNGLGCLFWLASGFGSLRQARVWTTAELHRRGLPAPRPVPVGAPAVDGWVTSARMRRYHRAGCPLVAGKPVDAVTVDAATTRGLTACGICAA